MPKIGKTTLAAKMPRPIILATEKGYSALPGVIAQDITTWGQMKEALRELKKSEVREMFDTVIIDTIDIAASLCQKYICNQLGIQSIGEGGWTNNGWARYKAEFEEVFRSITQLGYALVFVSHDKETTITRPDGTGYTRFTPSLQSSACKIVENMVDIYAYAHYSLQPDGTYKRVLTLRNEDGTIACGGRFSKIAYEIPLNYDALVNALNKAIDEEAAENNNLYITDVREETVIEQTYDYEALMAEFQTLAGSLMQKNSNYYSPRITQIIDKYLGRGKKVSDATIDQAEFIYLIVNEIKEDLVEKE